MSLNTPTMDHIRTDLVSGIDGANHRRSRRRRMAAVVPVSVLAIGAAIFLPIGNEQPAFAMTQTAEGLIRVEVHPEFDEVDDLQASLAEAGLESIIVHLKGHPSLDGVVEISSHNNEQSGSFEFADGVFVIDPSQVEGEVEILIYSAAAEGENYQFAPSLFAQNQPLEGLHCAYTDSPLPAGDFEMWANERGLQSIKWVLFDRSIPGEIGTELDERPEGAVIAAQLRSADTLVVTVALDAEGAAADTLSMSDGTHLRPTPECSADFARRWVR